MDREKGWGEVGGGGDEHTVSLSFVSLMCTVMIYRVDRKRDLCLYFRLHRMIAFRSPFFKRWTMFSGPKKDPSISLGQIHEDFLAGQVISALPTGEGASQVIS